MTWAIVLIHIVGNPMLATSEPRFATLPECRDLMKSSPNLGLMANNPYRGSAKR